MFLNQHFNLTQKMDTEHRLTKDKKDGRPRLVTFSNSSMKKIPFKANLCISYLNVLYFIINIKVL